MDTAKSSISLWELYSRKLSSSLSRCRLHSCWCRVRVSGFLQHADCQWRWPSTRWEPGCNMACSGNSAETCGGTNRLNAYQWLGTGSSKRGINYTPDNNYNNATLANY